MNRFAGEDSTDVKYIDAYHKFIGVGVGDRFSSSSYLHIWESLDGLTFTSSDQVTANTQDYAHNAGISGTADGHLDISDNNFIAYAYSQSDGISWGVWNTYLNPITIVPEPGALLMLCSGAFVLLPLLRSRWKNAHR